MTTWLPAILAASAALGGSWYAGERLASRSRLRRQRADLGALPHEPVEPA